jgi:hypothetical protein
VDWKNPAAPRFPYFRCVLVAASATRETLVDKSRTVVPSSSAVSPLLPRLVGHGVDDFLSDIDRSLGLPYAPARASIDRRHIYAKQQTGEYAKQRGWNMKWRCVLLTGITLAPPTTAFADDCEDAVRRYNSILSDMNSTMRRLTSCVADSKGRDDCSSEFHRLKSAHGDFESAVTKYRRDCSN